MAEVTLKQIADIAGVSVATVSYVLNGKNNVSKATELRVLSVAKQLNYMPNLFAKQLKTRESRFIFALLNTYSSTFNGETLQKIEQNFEEKGYQLLAITSGVEEITKVNLFDGGIILNYHTTDEEIGFLQDTLNRPLILLSNQLEYENIASVTMDNKNGMELILKEIAKSIHNNICFIQGPSSSFNNRMRVESARYFYQKIFRRTDFDIHLYQGNFHSDQSYKLSKNLLESGHYNAFICFNDRMALGVYKAAHEMGLTVGEDISVTGFDNNSYTDYIAPGLTTIDVDRDIWAKEVVNSYLALKEGILKEKQIMIPSNIIVRNSIRYK